MSTLPHFLDSRLTDGGEVSLTLRRHLYPQEDSWHSFLLEAESTPGPYIVQLEGLGQLKNPMTSSGIEPATFRLVAQCLNQLRYRVPLHQKVKVNLTR
jgi:hypothetical protein